MPGGPGELSTDISPFQMLVTTGPTLVVLTVIVGHPSATTIDNFEKTGLLFTRPGNSTAHLGLYPRSRVESVHGLGILLLLRSRVGF